MGLHDRLLQVNLSIWVQVYLYGCFPACLALHHVADGLHDRALLHGAGDGA
jgi:hypothetical protein